MLGKRSSLLVAPLEELLEEDAGIDVEDDDDEEADENVGTLSILSVLGVGAVQTPDRPVELPVDAAARILLLPPLEIDEKEEEEEEEEEEDEEEEAVEDGKMLEFREGAALLALGRCCRFGRDVVSETITLTVSKPPRNKSSKSF